MQQGSGARQQQQQQQQVQQQLQHLQLQQQNQQQQDQQQARPRQPPPVRPAGGTAPAAAVAGAPGDAAAAAAAAAAGATAANPNPDPLREVPNRYIKINDLSKGSFGFVQLARSVDTSELVAIKFIERGDRVNRYVEAEILNHRMLRHPHVIEFKEVFLTSEYVCIVMEYASGGSLFTYVARAVRLKEAAARWFFQQLIIGLDYCHRRGVVNRDIKLENTLLQIVPGLPLPLLKICDFGYSKAHFMSAPKSKVGTLAYMAPEIIKTTGNYDGKQADIWSCGVMLYVMLYGQYPFDTPATSTLAQAARIRHMMDRIVRMQWSIPENVTISGECRSLLTRMLVADPERRVTMAQIQQHPWFLTNLPGEAVHMNDNYLAEEDYTGVQSVEDIKLLLRTAQTPGPGKYNFGAYDETYEELIEDAIHDEFHSNEGSFNVQQYQQRGMGGAPLQGGMGPAGGMGMGGGTQQGPRRPGT